MRYDFCSAVGAALNTIERSAVAPGAMLLTTTEVEPLSDVKIGVFSTSSEANVNIILEAATSEDAFFIRTRSSNGCPA